MTVLAGDPVLELDRLTVRLDARAGRVLPLDGVSLALRRGESLGVVGESGSGKTTLVRAVAGDLPRRAAIAAGRLLLDGRDIARFTDAARGALRYGGVAVVPQQAATALNPVLTVGEQLAEVPRYGAGVSRRDARSLAGDMLTRVLIDDPARALASYPHQLSGGQLQRVAIAMALLSKPRLLLLDEPTTGLDTTVQAGILDLVAELRTATDLAVLYISHDLGVAAAVCDRLAVLYAGEVVESGPTADVLGAPLHPYARGLVRSLPSLARTKRDAVLTPIRGVPPALTALGPGCRFADRCDHAQPECAVRRVGSETAGPGREVRCRLWNTLPPDAAVAPLVVAQPLRGDVLLRVEALTKHYRGPSRGFGRRRAPVVANDGISFEMHRNEVFAVVGESGSGKSSLAKVIAGLETATSGRVVFDGVEIGSVPVARRSAGLKRTLQMVAQNSEDTLNPSYRAGRQIGRAIRRLRGVPRGEIAGATAALLGDIRLPQALAGSLPETLSGGQKQRAAIARAIAGDPKLVIADEPVSALDASVQAAILELLLDLQRGKSIAVLLISHDLAVVHHVADRIAVLYRGRVVETGGTGAVFAPPHHPYTAMLLSAVPQLSARDRHARERRPADAERTAASGGCVFEARCPRRIGAICADTPPPVRRTPDGLSIACHIELPELGRDLPARAAPPGRSTTRPPTSRKTS